MRRHWLTALLFVLAMVAQTIAPATSHVALAKGAAGRSIVVMASGAFCLTAGGAATDENRAPGKSGHHHDQCPLCQSLCDGAAPPDFRAAFNASAPGAPMALPWRAAQRALPAPDFNFARQARAPPSFS